MMVDESWSCYVAYPIDKGWVWGGVDPMWDALNSCMGQYHGAPIRGFAWYPSGANGEIADGVPLQSATLGFYDGHCELKRDPFPNVEINGAGRAPLNPWSPSGEEYLRWIAMLLYAQLGLALDLTF